MPHIKAPDTGQVLFLGCASAELALHLAQQHPQLRLTLTDAYVSALAAARQLFANHQLFDVHILPPPPAADIGGDFDLVIIEQPQSRALARRWLCEAQQRLRDNGWLYISGPNELGIKSVIADVQALFGSVQVLGYAKHGRAACVQNRLQPRDSAPAWASEPGIAPGRWYELPFDLDAQRYTLRSLAGVFSYERLDAGTALLLDTMDIPADAQVLDAGCGYGVLGLAAALRGATHVDMLDINMLAVAAARENSVRVGLPSATQVEVLACDGLACVSDRRYDLIITNPPFHQGKQIDYHAVNDFVEHGKALLLPTGRLLLVENAFLHYERQLSSFFRRVTIRAENRSFRVIEAQL